MAACLRGDQDAWETLVRSHAGLVYTVIRRCGLDEAETADLFQDVWLAAWEGLGGLRDENGLAAWLATIAVRRARRALSARVRYPAGDEAEALRQPDPDPEPPDVTIEREQVSTVRAAIDRLSARDRRLVYYFFYDPSAPSYAEIAAELGVATDTIGPLRSRCLRRLRLALEAERAPPDGI